MGFDFFSQLLEIATTAILVVVLLMLYNYGKVHYVKDISIAFSIYLAQLLISLFLFDQPSHALFAFVQYALLVSTSLFIYRSAFDVGNKLKDKRFIFASLLVILIIPVTIILTDNYDNAEGMGYVILGLTFVSIGIRWYRILLPEVKFSNVLGVAFIIFGVHLMDFVVVQYNATTLIYGYFLAAALEAVIATILMFMNFAEMKMADEVSFAKYMNLFNNSSDAILMIEKEVIFDCNEKAIELFETSKEVIVGKKPMDLSVTYQENGRYSYDYGEELFLNAATGQVTRFDWVHRSVYGKQIKCEVALFPIGENQFASIIRNMNDKYAYEKELNFHKYYDGITKLPKRELFIDRLERMLEERRKQVALIAFNIDNFKEINDQYGHTCGDELLRQVAVKILGAFNREVTITRLGGDQFVVMMDKLVSNNKVYLPIERIEGIFREPFLVAGDAVDISACLGVAFPETESTDAMELLKNVDFALNIAKKKGRGSLEFYSVGGMEEFSRRVKIERELRVGIGNGEIVPYYQPIVEPLSGKIIGAEALARWRKDNGEMIYPDQFIPIAEETGLIISLGNQILYQACITCKALLKYDRDFVMHVNLSALQLKDFSMVHRIREVLETTELTARHLQIELTETAYIEDGEHVNQVLRQIRNLGVQVALDDFGTGYSSMSYLTEMEVDTIKIDRKFVVKLPRDDKAMALIRFLTKLIHDLGYKIVVEGVEEKDQLDLLIELGCDYIQGYYFYRPMPYDRMLKLLKKEIEV